MNVSISDGEAFDTYYVLKIFKDIGEVYYYSKNLCVRNAGMAKPFNTLRSVRRIAKLYGFKHYEAVKRKREF